MKNKILVIGYPGSGKSYFSKQLVNIIKLPLYHLDNIYWKEDKTNLDQKEFISEVNKIMDTDSWVIDGMYLATLEERLLKADYVIFFDCPIDECINGIMHRTGKRRIDIPWIENTDDEEKMIEYIKNYYEIIHDTVYEILDKYPALDKTIITSRIHAAVYLDKIRKECVSRETIY